MRILHLSSGKNFGGGERHVLELVRALAARGHAVHVGLRPRSALFEKLSEHPEITLHPLGLRNALDVASAWKLCRLAERERIDILHAHYGRDYPLTALAVRLARARGKAHPAFFLTRHHFLPLSSNFVYRKLLSVADGAIAVSGSVRETLCRSLAWSPERVRVVSNWVDAEKFQTTITKRQARERFNLPPEAILVGVVNQLAPAKGQLEAVRALSMLSSEPTPTHLVLAGREHGGESFTDELKRSAKALNLADRVHFLGFTTEVSTLLAALDVVLIPSLDEAFSLGALEALAARVPVVASNVGGLGEILTHETTALLVPPLSVESLAEAAQRLTTDADLRNRLVQNGFHEATTRYALDRAVEQVETMYAETLRNRFKDVISDE